MKSLLSAEHKARYTEIRDALVQLGPGEGVFSRTELLFYDALSIAHEYGTEGEGNFLIIALKELQHKEYKATTAHFAKAAQRERAIRQFMSGLKTIITKAIKGTYLAAPIHS